MRGLYTVAPSISGMTQSGDHNGETLVLQQTPGGSTVIHDGNVVAHLLQGPLKQAGRDRTVFRNENPHHSATRASCRNRSTFSTEIRMPARRISQRTALPQLRPTAQSLQLTTQTAQLTRFHRFARSPSACARPRTSAASPRATDRAQGCQLLRSCRNGSLTHSQLFVTLTAQMQARHIEHPDPETQRVAFPRARTARVSSATVRQQKTIQLLGTHRLTYPSIPAARQRSRSPTMG